MTSFPHPLILQCLAPAQAGTRGWGTQVPLRAVLPKVQVNFPVKHHHEMNPAVLPCCLWKHRNASQTTPRQAQHALKYRGCTSFGRRQASVTELLSSSSSSALGYSQAGALPALGWHPALWHLPGALGGQTAMGCSSQRWPSLPHLTQVPPQCHLEIKPYEKESILCVSKATAISLTA